MEIINQTFNESSLTQRIPTHLRLYLLDYINPPIAPSIEFAKQLQSVKTLNNLKKYDDQSLKIIKSNSIKTKIKLYDWVLVKCLYCKQPKAWTKIIPKIKHQKVPFYKYNIKCQTTPCH